MIQRKQTIFLLLSAIALGLLHYFPLASFIGDKDSLVMYIYQVVSLVPDQVSALPDYFIFPILAVNSMIILLTILTIFLFKNRRMQLNLLRFSLILLLIMIGSFFFYYVNILEKATGGLTHYEIGSYMPLVAFVFYILAYRGIMSDEKLVRSADRLR
ncbi:MAG: DUF4293 domain-containing protein [Bacteroidetes bacterium]|nr:DUF4293 domain-containing protein [Bacteroidota bacterium]